MSSDDPGGDPFALVRFLAAQDDGGTYETAMAELRAGAKRSHWMWFVFPQLAGLGSSAMSQRYAIGSLEEARAYAVHPVLGARLREGARILLGLPPGARARAVMGDVDAAKLRSSMTLFARAVPAEPLFAEVLQRYFSGEPDARTDALLTHRTPRPPRS